MTIYDYANRAVEVELPDKPIAYIEVVVVYGDETGNVGFTDGTMIQFDASGIRFTDYYDGSYVVRGEGTFRPGLISNHRASALAFPMSARVSSRDGIRNKLVTSPK